ncbi:MAG: hypothetical protein QCI38_08775, partial [Candidatus Thermoplasmatota archaeon]|nr:hypothetical protein [Candidatus Thermoplasmatota archaeon]
MLFPLHVSAPAFMGLAFVDPLIGHLDGKRRCPGESRPPGEKRQTGEDTTSWMTYPGLPLAFYALLAFSWFRLGADLPLLESAILSSSMAVVAIAVEKPSNPWLDDDFLMVFVPGAFLYALAMIAGIAW